MADTKKSLEKARRELIREIHDELAERFGAPILIGGAALTTALSLPSQAAFRQANHRGALPVHVFRMKQRRGFWALTREVAEHIAAQRIPDAPSPKRSSPFKSGARRRKTNDGGHET